MHVAFVAVSDLNTVLGCSDNGLGGQPEPWEKFQLVYYHNNINSEDCFALHVTLRFSFVSFERILSGEN